MSQLSFTYGTFRLDDKFFHIVDPCNRGARERTLCGDAPVTVFTPNDRGWPICPTCLSEATLLRDTVFRDIKDLF